MKILSYKILNETTVNLFNRNASALGGNFALGGGISRNLLKTTRMSKERGIEGANDTLKLFTRFIQLKFNFYDANANPALNTDLNVAFGIYFTNGGNTAHLIPYTSKSIQSLLTQIDTNTQQGVIQYATLELFDPNNNQAINIEGILNNFQQSIRYNFSLTIPDINNFRRINSQYRFANLNQLEQFANTGGVSPYTIGLNQSSGFRRITNDGNEQTNITYTNIALDIQPLQGQQLTQPQTNLNTLFNNTNTLNCTIVFNRANRPRGINSPQGTRFTTSIQSGQNIAYIYTQNSINTNRITPMTLNGRVYVSLGQSQPEECNLIILRLS
jgi:hypothetical protein